MAQFTNGTQGDDYRYALCSKCKLCMIHEDLDCPIWAAHEDGMDQKTLDYFIPVDKETGEPKECRWFVPIDPQDDRSKVSRDREKLRVWNETWLNEMKRKEE